MRCIASAAFATAVLVAAGCGTTSTPTTSRRTTQPEVVAARSVTVSSHRAVGHRPANKAIVVKVTKTAFGPTLTDRRGFALYLFTHDITPSSTCYGACATAWPPYVVNEGSGAPGPGARAGLLGAVRRRNGHLQVTYGGHPLYYYVGDRRPGQILCQAVPEFGGTWYVVTPDGRAVR